METQVFDGRAAAVKIRDQIKKEARERGLKPSLAVILVGQNPASLSYIKQKQRSCEELGWGFNLYQFPENVSLQEVERKLSTLNFQLSTSGIILQLPLPLDSQLSTDHLIGLISPNKEIDGLGHSSRFISPTAQAVQYVLAESGIEIKGKKVAVLGRGKTSGAPIAQLLKEKGAEVFVVSSQTPSPLVTRNLPLADIVVSCVGKPNLIKGEMIKEDAVVIGVGLSRAEISHKQLNSNLSPLASTLSGDLDEPSLMGRASLITPTPGGIGPLTVVFLLKNLMEAAKNNGGMS